MLLFALHFVVRRLSLAAVMTLGYYEAAAQQAIQYSKPAVEDPYAKANVILPSQNGPGAFNAPKSFFNDSTPSINDFGAPPQPNPDANQFQWRKPRDDRRNWALQTPEQILGIPTPETILGITDSKDASLSPEQRFLQGQEQRATAGVTNLWMQAYTAQWHKSDASAGPFQNQENSTRYGGKNGDNFNSSIFESKLDSLPKNPNLRLGHDIATELNRPHDSAWAGPFATHQALPEATPEQMQGMERFRALMEPQVSERTPAMANGYAQPVNSPGDGSIFQTTPGYKNQADSVFKALSSDIGRPRGITPLPGINDPRPAPPVRTSLVQAPPWMSTWSQNSGPPQNGTLQQRQF